MKKVEVFIVQLLCIVLRWPGKHQISYPYNQRQQGELSRGYSVIRNCMRTYLLIVSFFVLKLVLGRGDSLRTV